MKSLSTTKSTALIIAAIAASIFTAPQMVSAQGNPAPVGSVEVAPEFVCNPNVTRWNKQGSRPGYYAREVQDLHVYNGKIYTAGGDWGAFSNQGPVPVFAIDPATGTFTNEYEAGTDIITDFKTFSDGRLWTACVDGRNGHENEGHFFRREQNGTWTNMTTCLRGHSGIQVKYFEHTWDIAEFDGMIFTAGHGICGSSNWGDTQMFDATPDLPSNSRTYASDVWVDGMHYFNVGNARKFSAFLSFADDLFCFSMNMGYKSDVEVFGWEEWRWDASLGKFVSSLVPWSDIAPGLTDDERSISLPETTAGSQQIDIMLTTCRSFGTRILYLVGGTERINVATHRQPWAAYSAINQNHHVKATKIDLGGARPFDIHVSGAAAYIVAAKGTEMGTVVTNSVWKTEDGVTFTELFHFATNRQATALCKFGSDFYVGMGYSTNVCHIWKNLPKNPELSGDIYRINLEGGSQGGGDPQGGDDPQGGSGTTDGVQEIGSYGEFAAAITEDSPAGARYRLTADINLAQWSAVDFRGILDGNGHTLEGLGNPLFKTVSGGRVENLTVTASTVVAGTNGGPVGFIAQTLECGAVVSNCTIASDSLLRVGTNVKGGAIVGCVQLGAEYAGEQFVGIFDCTNHATIEKTGGDYNTSNGGSGGIVGHLTVSLPSGQSSVECRIARCFNDGTITSPHAACNIGGIAGYAKCGSGSGVLCFEHCCNEGTVACSATGASAGATATRVGGIVGVFAQIVGETRMVRCVNRGRVESGTEPEGSTHDKKTAGGIAGCIDSFSRDAGFVLVDSANYGAVSGNRAGGMVAQVGANVNYVGTYVVISNVANYGAVSGVTASAQCVGKATVPTVQHVRRIVNSFFGGEASLFGDLATADDYVASGVVTAGDEGYVAYTAKNSLDAFAEKNGNERWVLGRVGDGVFPELACFMTKPGRPGFKVSIR